MKFARSLTALGLAGTVALAGCSDEPDVLTIDDVAGVWNATSLVFGEAAPFPELDLVAAGGGFSITVQANGVYSQTTTFPDGTEVPENGTITLTNSTETTATATLVSQDGSETDTFELEFFASQGQITLSGTAPHALDPTQTVQTNITAVLQRQ